jgi:HSP20 family protein
MSIVRFDPWRALDRVESARWVPAVDVWETADAFHIDMDVPAVASEDVEVSVDEGVLTIAGERKREPGEVDGQERRGHRYERRYGSFARRFRLPDTVDAESIEARVVAGVLHVSIGKRAELKPRRIEVVAA